MKTRPAILALSAVLLIGFATVAEAKKFGGGKSSGSSAAPAKKPGNKADEPSEPKGGSTVSIRLPGPGGGNSSTGSTAMSVGAAALGAAAGSASARNLSPEEAKKTLEKQALKEQRAQKAEEERKAEETRKKEEQKQLWDKAAVVLAEKEKREKLEAAHLTQIKNEKEIERQRKARENLCVIKPVMTDAEIALCKEVWR